MKKKLEEGLIKSGLSSKRAPTADVETSFDVAGSEGAKGVLRLRACPPSRNNHCAQDDRFIGVVAALLCVFAFSAFAFAGDFPRPAPPSGRKEIAGAAVQRGSDADTMRVQGEQRFRTNCARCHAAPQKFPPRMMATVLRHMRVRATITDQDMRLVLFYMTQ